MRNQESKDYILFVEIFTPQLESLGFVKSDLELATDQGDKGEIWIHPDGWMTWFYESVPTYNLDSLEGYSRVFFVQNEIWPPEKYYTVASIDELKGWMEGSILC